MKILPLIIITLLVSLFSLIDAHAQQVANAPMPIGQIEYSRGVSVIQQPGQQPRFSGPGQALYQGDVLTTSDKSLAAIKLNDGTRMTLRPDTQVILQNYAFDQETKKGNFLFEMLKGGLRTLTGILTKIEGNSGEIKTPVASLGIRGTDFDARLCAEDCAKENQQIVHAESKNRISASARVVQLKGLLTAIGLDGVKRFIAVGGPAYPGDLLETGRSSSAILAFRDESRISIGEQTRLKIEDFVFDMAQPKEGRFFVNLVKGASRMMTGLIGKANQRNVEFRTTTATIGIRGTGFDVTCYGTCAAEPRLPLGDGMTVYTWQGEVIVVPAAEARRGMREAKGVILPAGRGGSFPDEFSSKDLPANIQGAPASGASAAAAGSAASSGLTAGYYQPMGELLMTDLPRPDSVAVDFQQTFGLTEHASAETGLYVAVRDGHVALETPSGAHLDLGRGETGFVRPLPQSASSDPGIPASDTYLPGVNGSGNAASNGAPATSGAAANNGNPGKEGVTAPLYNGAPTASNPGGPGGNNPGVTGTTTTPIEVLRPVNVPNFIEYDVMPLPSQTGINAGSNTFDLIPLLERNGVKPALICK